MRAPRLQLPRRADRGRVRGRRNLARQPRDVVLDLLDGRVLRIVAGTYHVHTPEGHLECSLRGRVKLRERSNVAVGDGVRVERLEDGSCRIRELLPRDSALTRRGVARRREQVIAANIDQVAAVAAVASPDPDFVMLDRLLALAELNELAAFVVLNKCDLAQGAPEAFAPYREAGYDVLRTSATQGIGLEELRSRLCDRTTVLAGQSGTGKSSLVNAVMPGLKLRVGQVGERSGRGRHTTVAASMFPFAGGGYVVDTPGLQVLALWEIDPADLAHAFPEVRALAAGCRFADCRHRQEPTCAIVEAVEAGELSERRYRSYLALLEEAEEGGR